MKRHTEPLGSGTFDLLVVGGGVYGAWTAYDAALRGLRVAIVERRDWASATSSNSSKLIHGGLRYLEFKKFGLVRKTLNERNRLRRLAPHRVRRLRFAIPLYFGGRLLRWKLRLGLIFYDSIARSERPLRGHEALSARRLAKRYDFLKKEGLQAGFTYGDCQTDDARFALELIAVEIGVGEAVERQVVAPAEEAGDVQAECGRPGTRQDHPMATVVVGPSPVLLKVEEIRRPTGARR